MAKFAAEHAPAWAASATMDTVAVTARGAAAGATAMASLASNPSFAALKLPVIPTPIRHALRGMVKGLTGV